MKINPVIILLLLFNLYLCKFPDNKTRDNIEEIYKAKFLVFDINDKFLLFFKIK